MKVGKSPSKNDTHGLDLSDFVSVILEEYKTLRAESIQCSINMFSAFSIGLGIVGAMAAGGFIVWSQAHLITLLVLYIFIPVVVASCTFLWLGEAARFKRVGDYICLIEMKLSLIFRETYDHIGDYKQLWPSLQKQIEQNLRLPHVDADLSSPLGWEQWLKNVRSSRPKERIRTAGHLGWVYAARLVGFMAIFVSSWIIAILLTLEYEKSLFKSYFLFVMIPLFLVFWGGIYYIAARKIYAKTESINLEKLIELIKQKG